MKGFVFNSHAMHNQETQDRLAQIEELLDEYKALVEQCERGYEETPEDFVDDVYVRTKIHVLVEYLDLDKELAFVKVMQKLAALDDRFKATLMPDKYLHAPDKHWWNNRILKFAWDEYREIMMENHGIVIGEA